MAENVRSMPTFKLYKGGRAVEVFSGADAGSLRARVGGGLRQQAPTDECLFLCVPCCCKGLPFLNAVDYSLYRTCCRGGAFPVGTVKNSCEEFQSELQFWRAPPDLLQAC